uniref:Uncharacterized protein n=1 Tax=Oryza sativa subsp. japonica TaxID=39947 RepID=Q10NY4_ORYSJ|nr:hypothetical protein LOC_Os03g14959 [Oryza sativa Japonica Group]
MAVAPPPEVVVAAGVGAAAGSALEEGEGVAGDDEGS